MEAPVRSDRVFFETYPHPAIVNVLRLDRRVAYKKGRVGHRRRKLAWLGRKLLGELPMRSPRVLDTAALSFVLGRDLEPSKGKALKAAEDAIDAVVCAFCAASWLKLGASGNEIIGSPGHGMMIFPKRDH